MTTARMAPAEPPFPQMIQETLDRLMPPGIPPLALFTTLARGERAFTRFMAAGLLDKGPVGLRERELMILRTCARCRSEYEWGVHVAFFGAKVQLTQTEIDATLARTLDASVFTPRERLILRLADALHDTSTVDDALWSELERELSAEQILELFLLAGFYHTVAYLTNGLAIPLEPFAARFPA